MQEHKAVPATGTDPQMPVVYGEIRGQRVSVLRDSGSNTVIVRRSLVRDEDLTGDKSVIIMVDHTEKWLPEAEIEVCTPYYSGKLKAKCMEDPLYDLILGNIAGVRKVGDPDCDWKPQRKFKQQRTEQPHELPEVEREDMGEIISAVQTRAKSKEEKRTRALQTPVSRVLTVTPDELAEQQRKDVSLKECFEKVGEEFRRKRSRTVYEFLLVRGVLFRRCVFSSGREVRQMVVPKSLRDSVLSLGHDSIMAGHQGVQRTMAKIMEEFFWPGLQSEVRRYVRSCDICQRTFPKGRVGRVPLANMPTIELPFQRVAIDLVGPIKPASAKGNRYVLTLVDVATRYPDAIPLKTIDTIQVAEALLEMFSRYGFPKEILSDRGANFTSELMKEINRLMSIKQLLTTPYHPMANGLVERFNGTMKNMIKKMCQERPKDWDRYLPALLFAYREVPQTSLGFSPFEMLYGRTVRGPLAILKELWANATLEQEVKTTYTYLLELRERLEETCRLAHESLDEAKEKYKKAYDRKSVDRKLEVGDRALILLPSDNNKLLMQWKGPFVVTDKKNEVDYELLVNNRKRVFHVNMLKKYEERAANHQTGVACTVLAEEEGDIEVPTYPTQKGLGVESVIISPSLGRSEVEELNCLLKKYDALFSDLPGRTKVMECKLQLTSHEPIHVKQYPLPLAVQESIEKEVDVMLQHGVIERSKSAYNAPLVAVRRC